MCPRQFVRPSTISIIKCPEQAAAFNCLYKMGAITDTVASLDYNSPFPSHSAE